jgi:hypothetical protein
LQGSNVSPFFTSNGPDTTKASELAHPETAKEKTEVCRQYPFRYPNPAPSNKTILVEYGIVWNHHIIVIVDEPWGKIQ